VLRRKTAEQVSAPKTCEGRYTEKIAEQVNAPKHAKVNAQKKKLLSR
jgi:hypothetical protein